MEVLPIWGVAPACGGAKGKVVSHSRVLLRVHITRLSHHTWILRDLDNFFRGV